MKERTIVSSSPQRSTLWVLVVVAVAIAAVILVGGVAMGIAMSGGHCCGGRGGADQTPAVASGQDVAIEIRDYDFSPRDITVDAGTTITWTNHDSAPHDAVSDEDGAWRTDLLQKDDVGSVTFDDAGVYPYHCSVHTYMEATVTVR